MGKMKLNYESREELRSAVHTYLASRDNQNNPIGKKVKLDKETLEILLFEEVVINPAKGIIVKLPVFSGDCLQYIDLSEVSFEDVSWGLLGKNDSDYFGILSTLALENGADKNAVARINKLREAMTDINGRVDYIYTNAVIDFSKSFEAKHGNCVNISSCYFLDNENMVPNSFDHVVKLNIADSGVVGMSIPKNIGLTAVNSVLKGIDLSSRRINAYDHIAGNDKARHEALGGCDLSETGISIELVPGKFKQSTKAKQLLKELYFVYRQSWKGCYINNKLNRSQSESAKIQAERRQAYDAYEKEYIESILGKIEEQTKK